MSEFTDYFTFKPKKASRARAPDTNSGPFTPPKVLKVVKSFVPRMKHSPSPNRLTYYEDMYGYKNSEEYADGGAISCESESSDDDAPVPVQTKAKKVRPAARVIFIESEDSEEEEPSQAQAKAKEASAIKAGVAQELSEDSDIMTSHEQFISELQEASGLKPQALISPTSLVETTQPSPETVISKAPSVQGHPRDSQEPAQETPKTAQDAPETQDALQTTPSRSPPIQHTSQSTLKKHRKFGIFRTKHLMTTKHVRDTESLSPTPHPGARRGRPSKRGRKVVEEVVELDGPPRSKYKTGHLSTTKRARETESPFPTPYPTAKRGRPSRRGRKVAEEVIDLDEPPRSKRKTKHFSATKRVREAESPIPHTAARPSRRRRKLDEEIDEPVEKSPRLKHSLRSRTARGSMVQEPKKAPNKRGSKNYNLRARNEASQRQAAFEISTSSEESEEENLTSTFSRENGGATRRVVSMVLID